MKVSILKTLSLAGSLICMAALQVTPAVAGSDDDQRTYKPAQQSPKTRVQIESEYLQALKDGQLLNNSESDVFGPLMSAKSQNPSALTREAVHADTLEWKRLEQGDVQMGGQ